MRYEFINIHKKVWFVTLMCEVLEVKRSGYYSWRNREVSQQKQANRKLDIHIQAIFEEHRGRYGSPRLTKELNARDLSCSETRVERRMKSLGLKAKAKRKFKMTTDSNHGLPVAPNRLEQNFSAIKPNQKWTSDITYSAPNLQRVHG